MNHQPAECRPQSPCHPSTRLALDPQAVRRAAQELGFTLDANPSGLVPPAEAAALVGALMAICQWHIQGGGEHRYAIDAAYHTLRCHLGFPCNQCGSEWDCDHYS